MKYIALVAGVLLMSAGFADDAVVPVKKADKIVFLGDSITQGGGGPKGYVTLIKKALTEKHPDLGLEFVNAGISGHKVPDLQARLERDVISKKPTVVFIYIGINDVWHSKNGHGTPKDKYEDGLKDLISKINQAGARVILCTPSVIGEKNGGANAMDKMLDEYADISRKVAADTKTQMCDLHKAFQEYEKANNPDNKDKGILTGDTVHLNDKGNQLVAEQMLKALGE